MALLGNVTGPVTAHGATRYRQPEEIATWWHGSRGRAAVTVGEIVIPAPVRLAHAVATATIVRDAAAFTALIVLATLLSVMSGLERLV